MKQLKVAAAIIINNGKILCVQRGLNKFDYISEKFEFPGGKIEAGELPSDTVVREIHEELEMNIAVEQDFLTVNHEYPDFKIQMHSFICSTPTRELELSEHISFKWLDVSELWDLDWAAADVPIVDKLIKELDQ
ncbi:8-oxo-dGTP diphosphatase [Psychrobacter pasteurii]|uniref:8-oxo-dGTP diphosphatase n=1 Tax=Psychrobacter pasteurii TaxID=1945520 RepID=A0A1R4EDN2_9GAMM|nr:(deoxy)nucleoside triphosphate pyrophosphohydrolase [Psychrobacter pasteurii]SJM36611.1 8-oxo-dGTP diphosphatase [Psychrobacter pasteurii]